VRRERRLRVLGEERFLPLNSLELQRKGRDGTAFRRS
jgi:hypothetical protein